MPNHTDNILRANGDFSLVQILEPYMTDGNLDFNKIDPVPQELMGIASPVKIVPEDQYEAAKAKAIEHKTGLPLTQEMSLVLLAKYGSHNWFDWCVENWGTKWSSYDGSGNNDEKSMSFYTAWSPPIPAIQKLADATGKSFELLYLGEGDGFIGIARINPNEPADCEDYNDVDAAPKWLKQAVGYYESESSSD